MQEITLIVHDINKGDVPPKSGYYLLYHPMPTGKTWLDNMYWDEKVKAWRFSEDDDQLVVPCSYWGNYWSEDVISEVVK